MRRFLIVFAKEPKKGKVKTRLKGYLTETECSRLYKAFLKDTIASFEKLPQNTKKVLAYDAGKESPRYLKNIGKGLTFYRQEGRGLGRRMHNAFVFARKMKSDQTVIVGTDSPDLPLKYVLEAFRRLKRNDLALGPSFDGGYYLIGLKEPCSEVFKGIAWGSSCVFKATLKNAAALKKTVAVLPRWHDVDTVKGLIRLKSDLKEKKSHAPWTKKFLAM